MYINLQEWLKPIMPLGKREKALIILSNAIAVYSLYQERGELPENISMIDFIIKSTPEEIKSEITIELIDEIFEYVSGAHSS